MVYTIRARNVNDALYQGARLLRNGLVVGTTLQEETRNGPVYRWPTPVVTVFERPMERVLFHPGRDANPFFHAVEAYWMIAGRNTLKDLTPYVKQMAAYSDDGGKTQPAAYGHRWREHFSSLAQSEGLRGTRLDQLDWAVKRLRKDPGDRRVIISMWDAETDISAADNGSKDVPCNLQIIPWVTDGRLHFTITNRSNDAVWGLYGANAVHFSVCLEYMAARCGLRVGTMTVLSNNFHAYEATANLDALSEWPYKYTPQPGDFGHDNGPGSPCPYGGAVVQSFPLFQHWGKNWADLDKAERQLQEDLLIFFDHGWREAATKARTPSIRQVLAPLAAAHQHWKAGKGADRYDGAVEILNQVQASDWRRAAKEWVLRRRAKWEKAQDDGAQHG